jgi:hypothetical protein
MTYRQITASNKYRAKKQEYDGKYYHSKGEAAYAQELDWRKKAGEIQSWERQVKIDLRVNGIHICNYYIDFRVTLKDGTVQYHEYKGVETPDWRIKWNLLNATINEIEPGAELIVVKHKSTWKSRKR